MKITIERNIKAAPPEYGQILIAISDKAYNICSTFSNIISPSCWDLIEVIKVSFAGYVGDRFIFTIVMDLRDYIGKKIKVLAEWTTFIKSMAFNTDEKNSEDLQNFPYRKSYQVALKGLAEIDVAEGLVEGIAKIIDREKYFTIHNAEKLNKVIYDRKKTISIL